MVEKTFSLHGDSAIGSVNVDLGTHMLYIPVNDDVQNRSAAWLLTLSLHC